MKRSVRILLPITAILLLTGSPVRSAPPPEAETPNPEVVRQLVEHLGPLFTIFLPPARGDLQLTAEQKKRLDGLITGAASGFQEFMQNAAQLPEEQRGKKHQEWVEAANKALSSSLGPLLKPEQHHRLHQIMLQRAGLFALGNPDVAAGLKLTNEQRSKFKTVMEETQRRFEALGKKAMMSDKPEEIQREAESIKKEQDRKMDALLTDMQRQEWKELLGKPLAL